MSDPIEKVPDADIIQFTFQMNFTREQLQDTRDFEGWLDRRLTQAMSDAKDRIMQKWRDYQPAPSFLPKDE